MADLKGRPVFSQQMPAPPPFWQKFTKDNIARVKQLKDSGESIPQDLEALEPPIPPENGWYRAFGAAYNIDGGLATLAEMGQPQFYPDAIPSEASAEAKGQGKSQPEYSLDRVKYLTRTVRSILLNFLELTDVLSEDPVEWQAKLTHIESLFLNAHMMVNEYRPHQARETLILMLEDEIERKRARIREIQEMKKNMNDMDAHVESAQMQSTAANGVKDRPQPVTARSVWDELEEFQKTLDHVD